MKKFIIKLNGQRKKELKDAQEKCDLFLMINEQGVNKYVSFY